MLFRSARAFTGWSFEQPIPLYPHGLYDSNFDYRPEEHDDSLKSFLGESGSLNGGDIIDIIVRQPATPTFIGRHLYSFFVADEPQVPAWPIEPPRDPDAIRTLVTAYLTSDGDIREVLRALFKSDFFKEAQYQRVKSPVELVTGVLNLVGTHRSPEPGIGYYQASVTAMGQELFNPPSVEGWHTGKEWINSGALVERVNFASSRVGDVSKPGVKSLIARILNILGEDFSYIELIDASIEVLGTAQIDRSTRETLIKEMEEEGSFNLDDQTETENRIRSEEHTSELQSLVNLVCRLLLEKKN